MVPFTWQFGERVRRIRKMAKLTQEEFGQILGVSRQTINAYENDRQRPPLDMMEKMCGEQEISPRWLLTGMGDPKVDIPYGISEEGAAYGVSEVSLAPEQVALINFITEDRGRAVRLTRFLMGEGLKHLPAGGSAQILGNI